MHPSRYLLQEKLGFPVDGVTFARIVKQLFQYNPGISFLFQNCQYGSARHSINDMKRVFEERRGSPNGVPHEEKFDVKARAKKFGKDTLKAVYSIECVHLMVFMQLIGKQPEEIKRIISEVTGLSYKTPKSGGHDSRSRIIQFWNEAKHIVENLSNPIRSTSNVEYKFIADDKLWKGFIRDGHIFFGLKDSPYKPQRGRPHYTNLLLASTDGNPIDKRQPPHKKN